MANKYTKKISRLIDQNNDQLVKCEKNDFVFASRYLNGGGSDDDTIITNGAGNYAVWVHRLLRFKKYNTPNPVDINPAPKRRPDIKSSLN